MFLKYLSEHWIEFVNLLIAGVGLPVLIWHVRGVHESVRRQTVNIQAQTLAALYDEYFALCRMLLRKPHLREYLYKGAILDDSVSAERRSEVETTCELMTGLLEHAVIQQNNIPPDSWSNCWEAFLKQMYNSRDCELARFYKIHQKFYAQDFRNLVQRCLEHDEMPT